VSKIVPITENDHLIEDKTGVKSGNESGPLFKLTPSVDDIADKYGIVGPDNVKLLVMGTVRGGGSGCMCPANALIRALIRHVTLEKKDVVIMDMEAGLEHLGRATVRGFNALICVVEPGTQSIETAEKIKRLSADIDVNEILAVGNKILEEEDRQFVEQSLNRIELEMVGIIPYDRAVLRADALRIAPLDFSPTSPAVEAIKKIKMILVERYS
jgi:CO dehydrogenase maturation factor